MIPIVKTPTIYLEREGVWVKLENLQWTGSIKARPAYFMLKDAVEKGKLREGDRFVEASSGNTAIALAMLSKMWNLHFIAIVPDDASRERIKILKYLGADVIKMPRENVIPQAEHMEKEGIFYIRQHFNPVNPLSHELSTVPEVLSDVPHKIDAVFAGVGTGGTITGMARALKRVYSHIKVYGIRPREGETIEGISRNYLPAYDRNIVDEEIEVSFEEARDYKGYLARKYGLFVGYTAAANILVASRCKREKGYDVVLTVAPDGGERYISEL